MKRMSVLMAVAFVDMIGLTLVLPLLALYALKMQADATTIGFLTASFPVAQLIASPVWGRVSDRYGRRPLCRELHRRLEVVARIARDRGAHAHAEWTPGAARTSSRSGGGVGRDPPPA